MAENDSVIGPASNSLAATLGGGSPKAPQGHKAVERAEGVVAGTAPPVLFVRGDIVLDTEKDLKVTVLKPYVAKGNNGAMIHDVACAKSGERWLQWEKNLRKLK